MEKPLKKDKILIDDKAFVVVNALQINTTLSAFGHEEKMAKKILIVGGGNIGFNLAKNLENDSDGVRVKIVENIYLFCRVFKFKNRNFYFIYCFYNQLRKNTKRNL